MVFCFRIDIDSAYGLHNGVPKILELLRQLDMPASFFVVMGGETGLLDFLSGGKRVTTGAPGVKLPSWEIARILLAPYNFAEKHIELLKQAKGNGHVVGCHGWKHREWTRGLDNLDVGERFSKIESKYVELFDVKPTCFTAPAFKTNKLVLNTLDKFGYEVAGDLDGKAPFRPVVGENKYKHVQVPVTLKDRFTRPLIEGLHFDGYSDDSIVKIITEQITRQESENGFSCFYCHDVFEGITKINLLKDILTFVKLEGFETATMQQVGKNCKEYKKVNFQ